MTEYGGFVMHGYWSKVRFESLEGWVFDAYLSKWPALQHHKRPEVSYKEAEDYLEYGKRLWGTPKHLRLDQGKSRPAADTLNCRDVYTFPNGVRYEIVRGSGDGGWKTYSFTLPDFSFEECYLFFIYNAGFFHFDPVFNPQYAEAVGVDTAGNSIRRTASSVRIEWGTCHYTFEKKGNNTIAQWYYSC